MTAKKFFKDFVFDSSQRKITFGEEVTGAASEVKNFYIGEFVLERQEIFFAIPRRLFDSVEFAAQVVEK